MLTNCKNCAAPINPDVDKCEYCGTSYIAMGVTFLKKYEDTKQLAVARRKEIERELHNLRMGIAVNELYQVAIQAMRKYADHG